MAHVAQIEFCKSVKKRFPYFFIHSVVLDIGSLDINGNNRYLFEYCRYVGVDIGPGPNVDVVSKGHEYTPANGEQYDVVISTECFEHDMFYEKTLQNMYSLLKNRGLMLFSCATTGRPEHGTNRVLPGDSPFTTQVQDWSNYYKNLTEQDIRMALDVDKLFSSYEFSTHDISRDLYFWGIKI